MAISTVSFDDLFDFSPEPEDQLADEEDYKDYKDYPAVGGVGPQPRDNRTGATQELANNGTDWDRNNANNGADWDRNKANNGTDWDRNNQLGMYRDTVVRQLLDELPQVTHTDMDETQNSRDRKQRSGNGGGVKQKLEKSRQSARECRARKKLRYQYLDDLIAEREKSNDVLREKLAKYVGWCHQLDKGIIPDGLMDLIKEAEKERKQ